MNSLNLKEVNHFLLCKQRLAESSRIDDIVRVVGDISGLHATGTREPYLALFARMRDFSKEQLDRELYIRRSLGKIRCMRGTLYILTKEMVPVAYAATKALVERLSRRYAEFRGISMQAYSGVSRSIFDLLKGREMTVAAIKAELDTLLHLSAVLNLMCDQGLLARVQSGNWQARKYRYALFGEYFPDIDLDRFTEAEAMVRLVWHYLSAFGPATGDDVAWWLGLSKAKVREALEKSDEPVVQLKIRGLTGDFMTLVSDLDVMAGAPNVEPVVNLLPNLDPYLMGYRHRERYLRSEYYNLVFDRSGNATTTVLLDGRVVGVWDFSDEAVPQVKVYLFEEVNDEVSERIFVKAQAIGRFLCGREVAVRKVSTMVPLTERMAGAFMSPLKGVTK